MIKFQSFLSSSSGNSTFVTDDNTNILIDCGASCAYIEKCLARLGKSGESLSGIFLTHAHADHIIGAGVLSKKYNLPIFATEDTILASEKYLNRVNHKNIKALNPDDEVLLEGLKVKVFSIPHDAKGSVSYTVTDGETKFGIATDSGCITEEILENLSGCDTVIVEANHDVNLLKTGPYPFHLKKRILGDFGHMSNDLCGELCVALSKSGTKEIWLGHLSDHNNLPSLAYTSVSKALLDNGITVGSDVALNVIPKYWIEEKI